MTITPQEAMKLQESDREEIAELERKIDESLRNRFEGGSVAINFRYSTRRVREEIERMYGAAGWNVEYVSDQRDGDFFQFSPKRAYGGERR